MKKTLVVLTLAMVFLGACGASKSPGTVAAQYLEGMLNADASAKKYESAAMNQGFFAGMTMVALAQLVDKERARNPSLKMQVKVMKVSETGETAAVELLAAPAGSKEGQGVPCTAQLQNEKSNGWMVVGMSCFLR